jgi:hypothetical protein
LRSAVADEYRGPFATELRFRMTGADEKRAGAL